MQSFVLQLVPLDICNENVHVQIFLFNETIELYILKNVYVQLASQGGIYIYIYIYIYRERERERVVLVDQKKDIQCGVCRNKETNTLYEQCNVNQ